jgi:hypothetical protein
MKPMVSFVLLAAFLQAGVPVFEIDLWPGEGRPVFETTTTTLELREAPSASSKITERVAVAPGQWVSFDDTRFRTVQTGRIRALVSTRITGRILGTIQRLSREDYYKGKFPSAKIDVAPGTIIDYLQYRAEGTCFVLVAKTVIDADPCPINDKSKVRVEAEPKTEWWIHVVLSGGSSKGWVLASDSELKLVRREF